MRLGAGGAQLPEECFTFLTKIHYKAPMPGESPQWGEHEIDHILVCRPPKDVLPHINTNECKDARYFSRDELDAFVAESDVRGDLVSPWFRVIHREKLPALWDAVDAGQMPSVWPSSARSRSPRALPTRTMGRKAAGGSGACAEARTEE